MKNLIVVLLAAAAVISTEFPAFADPSNSSASVVAYYFHGAMRCPTCYKLEQYAKEVIESDFKEALGSGKLVFKAVNVDDKGNEHYAKDYKLYTKSLVLSLVKDGKETKWKNLDKIWEYVGHKKKYDEYVKTETAAFLKEAS